MVFIKLSLLRIDDHQKSESETDKIRKERFCRHRSRP